MGMFILDILLMGISLEYNVILYIYIYLYIYIHIFMYVQSLCIIVGHDCIHTERNFQQDCPSVIEVEQNGPRPMG